MKHIGRQVDARVGDTVVEIFADGELIKTWPRIGKGRRTDHNDYPPEKIAFFMRSPLWCRTRADELGEHVSEIVAGLLADHALHHLRAAQGIIGLAGKYSPQRLEAACRRALEVGDPSYRTVKGILAVGADQLETVTADSVVSAATPAHLYGPDSLFAHLEQAEDHNDGIDGGIGAVGA